MLKSKGVLIAAASRTNEPEWAIQLLQLFDIDKYFDIKEIYPGSKITHLNRIQEQIGCPFDQMVFLDDEDRNIGDARSLGVNCVLVNNGITLMQIENF
jgi:magnesium-dependent phosphatase 1